MNRRDFVRRSLILSTALCTRGAVQAEGKDRRFSIIDAHCHAGRGFNYGKSEATTDPWTTYNDPQWTLRRMDEAGIDQTIICLLYTSDAADD